MPTRVRVGVIGLLCAVGVALAGCATGAAGTASPTSTPSESPSAPTPTAEPTLPPIEPAPTPSGSESSDTVYDDGEILITTAGVNGGALEVSAMVPGVSEADGTCTLEELTSGVSTTTPGNAGNGVTYCGLMAVTPAAGDAASWSFRVRYDSPTTRAESAVASVESAE